MRETFLQEVCQAIIKQEQKFTNTVCILPSERAGTFLKNEFKKQSTASGFLPEFISIENFIKNISGFNSADSNTILFDFYKCYLQVVEEEKANNFDSFLGWATIVLQDFNEIDRHLVDANDLFENLISYQRISQWSKEEDFIEQSNTIKGYLSFIELLPKLYAVFYKHLHQQKKGYQGILYKEAHKNHLDYIEKNQHLQFNFIGFNALNKAEEEIFKSFLANPKHKAYWDADENYIHENNKPLASKKEAGHFLRKYFNQWPNYQKNEPNWINNNLDQTKKITILGTPTGVSGIKTVADILDSHVSEIDQTALVLADEEVLPIVLNSIPTSIDQVNITMGYGLNHLPIANLFKSIIELQQNYTKLGQKGIYHKDLIKTIRHPFVMQFAHEELSILMDTIQSQNMIFIHQNWLQENINNDLLLDIFKPFDDINLFIKSIIAFFKELHSQLTDLNQHTTSLFIDTIEQIVQLNEQYGYINNIKILYKVYQKLVSSTNVDFKGKALKGLQLMGMLETRCLDFKNVIITSVNEGVLPTGKSENSFIPFDVKKHYDIPNYFHKDAVFSYHFYRLIQRAENVYIVYNTQKDDFGGGEKSRFISQLQIQRDDVTHQYIQPQINVMNSEAIVIEKTESIISALQNYLQKGISPTNLNNYILDPLVFYKKVILKIRDTNEVEEEVAANTLGTIVHDTLEVLYTPYIGKILITEDYKIIKNKIQPTLDDQFKTHFKAGEINTGKNRIIYEVALQFVQKFINKEYQQVKEGNEIVILELEQDYKIPLTTKNGYSFYIRGKVDRVDELNGVRRIVDYKTGKVEGKDLKLDEFDLIPTDYKYGKINQVMMYVIMYTQQHQININEVTLQTGIYSFKNFKEGFIPMNFAAPKSRQKDYLVTNDRIESFKETLCKQIDEILNVNLPFTENLDNPYK